VIGQKEEVPLDKINESRFVNIDYLTEKSTKLL